MRDAGFLLAVDPSIRSSGVAVFRDGLLQYSETITLQGGSTESVPARALRMAEAIGRWLIEVAARPRTLVLEDIMIMPHGRGNSNPNSLVGIARVGSTVAGMLSIGLAARDLDLQLVSYKPAEWCGGLPKSTTGDPFQSARARRILSKLSTDECDRLKRQHDAVDACGLGLKAIGRFEPVRVYSGAGPRKRKTDLEDN